MADQIYVNSSFTAGVFAEAFPLLPGGQFLGNSRWVKASKPMFYVNGGDEDEIARFLNVCQGARRWIHSHFTSFQGFNWSIMAINLAIWDLFYRVLSLKNVTNTAVRDSVSVSHVPRTIDDAAWPPWGIAWVSFPACAGSQGIGQVYFWGHFFPVQWWLMMVDEHLIIFYIVNVSD